MTSLEELLGEPCAQKSVGTISRIAGSLFAGAEIFLARHKEPTLLEHADFGMLSRDLSSGRLCLPMLMRCVVWWGADPEQNHGQHITVPREGRAGNNLKERSWRGANAASLQPRPLDAHETQQIDTSVWQLCSVM